jgi:sugar phosphate permease
MTSPSINRASVAVDSRTFGQKAFSAGNIVLFLVCLMYGLTYIDRINVNTASLEFQKALKLDPIHLGQVFSAFGWAYLALQVHGGWISDRFGARRTLTVCGIIWAGATIMMGLSSGFAMMIVARVILGLGEGATFPTATRALSDWAPASLRGFVQGITHAFARLGNALTPPLVAWLIWKTSWRGSFIVLGIVSLVWAVVWWLYFRDDPAQHPGISREELQKLPSYAARMAKRKEPAPWGALVKRISPVTAVYFCYGWTLWLYLTWLPQFFKNTYKLDLKKSALFSAGVFFAGVIGDTLGGIVSDYVLHRTGNRNRARRDIIIVCFLASFAFMLPVILLQYRVPAAQQQHYLNVVALCLSAAFFFAECTIGPFWAIPMDIAPRYSGAASGLMNVGSALAAAVSPLVAGYVIQWKKNYSLPFLGSMGLLLLGVIMSFAMKPNEPLKGAEAS